MENRTNDDSISLGINIGAMTTVYSRFLKKDNRFQTEVLLSDTSSRTIPSQICYTETHRLYGDTAGSLMKKFYDCSYSYLSRLIGYFFDDNSIYSQEKYFLNENTLELANGKFRTYYNERTEAYIIIADFLSLINKYFFEKQNIKYNDCTLSVPDYYCAYQKQILKNICESIGMKNVKIINESLAITMYYGYSKYRDMFVTQKINVNKSIEKNIIFIDIGHSKTSFIYSTFNYAIFKVNKVKCLYNLGGRNFDSILLNECYKDFSSKNVQPSDIQNFKNVFTKQKKRIIEAIIVARKALSMKDETLITVESLYDDIDLNYKLTRDNFNKIIEGALIFFKKELIDFKNNLPTNKEFIVEMAGEIMRYPIFQNIIQEIFNVPISKTIIIDECTSVGASLCGFYFNNGNKLPSLKFFDKLIDHNYYEIGYNLKYGNKNEFFLLKDNLNEYSEINIKDIELIHGIQITYNYNQQIIKPLSKNPILCKYLIDLNQLRNDNPHFNRMNKLKIHHIYQNDTITIECIFIEEKYENGRIYQKNNTCNYNNSISLIDDYTLINNDNTKIKKDISEVLEKHSEKDKEYDDYTMKREKILRQLYDLKDNNQYNKEKKEEIERHLKQISQLEKSNKTIQVKKDELEEIKKFLNFFNLK